MGLARVHIELARKIGFDAFMQVWQHYDGEPMCHTDKGDLEIRMRPYRSYMRYQRNRFIETLLAAGMKPAEVQAQLLHELCEKVSPGHISRIGRKGRMRA